MSRIGPMLKTTAFTRMLLAACIVSAGGALAGSAIGESPVLRKGIGGALPAASSVFGGYSGAEQPDRPLPDHYPLVTAEGTVPVAELTLRGRLRDRQSTWSFDDEDAFYSEADYPALYSDAELRDLAKWDPGADARAGRFDPDSEARVEVIAGYRSTHYSVTKAERLAARADASPVSGGIDEAYPSDQSDLATSAVVTPIDDGPTAASPPAPQAE